ncbi:hypothetical protein ACFSM5_18260 [Lacibacterium aquatile]|uniref:Uncharacterized protein n=1 Tax=Lacibacterium aquatile TaxID=1168082 RepID=A0ABW5DY04_9PROT
MKLTPFLLIASVLLPISQAISQERVIEETGFGPLRIGMSMAELDALGLDVRYGEPDQGEVGDYCTETGIGKLDLGAIVEGRVLARVYFWDATYATGAGIRVGHTEQQVRDAYGDALTVKPHAYTNGSYLFKLNDQGVGLVFETDRGIVSGISIGKLPAIRYIEGCS